MAPRNAALWLALIQEGVAADRPTVPNLPPNTGGFYIATDTGAISVWTNNAWSAFGNVGSSAGVTFANLPAAPVVGQTAYVTDLSAATIGTNAAGGGANKGLVGWDGAHWTIGAVPAQS